MAPLRKARTNCSSVSWLMGELLLQPAHHAQEGGDIRAIAREHALFDAVKRPAHLLGDRTAGGRQLHQHQPAGGRVCRPPKPVARLQAIEDAGERRPLVAEATVQLVDRARRVLRQIGEHVGFGLREAQIREAAVDPERHRVGGPLESRHEARRVTVVHTVSYNTKSYEICQACGARRPRVARYLLTGVTGPRAWWLGSDCPLTGPGLAA